MPRSMILTYSALAAMVLAVGIAHAYRWWRWLTYGEPMP